MKLYEAQNIIKDVFENKFDKEKHAYFIIPPKVIKMKLK